MMQEKYHNSFEKNEVTPCNVYIRHVKTDSFLCLNSSKLGLEKTKKNSTVWNFKYVIKDELKLNITTNNDKLCLKDNIEGNWFVKRTDTDKRNLFIGTDSKCTSSISLKSDEIKLSTKGDEWELVIVPSSTIKSPTKQIRNIYCPCCYVNGFTEDELWYHYPKFHGDEFFFAKCPICIANNSKRCHEKKGNESWGFSSHIFLEHGPDSRIEKKREMNDVYSFSLVICRHPNGKYLLVQEGCSVGWWLPAGRVDAGETFFEAAIRETKEEGGIDVNLEGILGFEYWPYKNGGAKQRCIFYATPKDKDAPLKNVSDFESLQSVWISYDELMDDLKSRKKKLRGNEPIKWFNYLEKGGKIHDLSLMSSD
eukprot:gene8522-346_t